MNAQEIENMLRLAPRSTPPPDLKNRLIAQLRLPAAQLASQAQVMTLAPASWLRRWWPALVPATVSLACAVVLTVQQMQVRDLRATLRGLAATQAGTEPVRPAAATGPTMAASAAEAAAKLQAEIARLKGLATQLTAEVAQLEQMSAENQKLRAQAAAQAAGYLTPQEAEDLAKAKESAESTACVNNLKQLGLAARTWAIDNGDVSPPDILSMTNEMVTPKILYCPSDKGRQAAVGDWASYTAANCSYEDSAPSAPDSDPTRVMFRCPIHGHVGLVDGSVQGRLAKDHPEQLMQRNGKLYYLEGQPQPPNGPSAPPSGGTAPNSTP